MPYLVALFAIVAGGLIMGFSPVFVRTAEVDAFASAFWRVFFALPVLFIWARLESPGQKTMAGIRWPVMFDGLFFAGDLIFWHLAILHTTMANATFMVCLAPVWVAVLSPFILQEKASTSARAGLILCIAGLFFLVGSSLQVERARLLGDIYGIVTSFFLAGYFIAVRFARQNEKSGSVFWKSTLVTTVVLLFFAVVAGDVFWPPSAKGWFSVVSLGVLTHAGGQGLVTVAMGVLTAIFSSLVIFIEAIAAAFFGWLLFEETMNALQWVGSFLILLGVWTSRPRA